MRKLIMWNLVTLDGFFEGPKSWDIDWHNSIWGEEMDQLSIEQLKSAGMLLFGRKTYEGMAAYWTTAKGEKGEVADLMNNIPKIVFSRTLEKAEWNNTRLVKKDAEKEISQMKQQPGKDMFIFGSADLSSTFIRQGIIDEYRICVTPVILGSGNPLFKTMPERVKLKLVEAKAMKSGGVILRYEPERGEK